MREVLDQLKAIDLNRLPKKLSKRLDKLIKNITSELRVSKSEYQMAVFICDMVKEKYNEEGNTRTKIEGRKIMCYLLHKHTMLTLTNIAEMVGYKTHHTVMHHIKSLKGLMEFEDELLSIVTDFEIRILIDFKLD